MEAAPIEAPTRPPSARAMMSTPTFGAVAESAATIDSRTRPARNNRRCPNRSLPLPTSGAATPKASKGAVTTHVTVATLVWRPRATWGSATTKTVKRRLVESSPDRDTHSTHHRYRGLRRARSPRARTAVTLSAPL